ncbi:uncharacterized protein LOC117628260 [Prunus dulcis]|nr:uncharacterized protein LOC117628260 [Prunus dulcis]
MINILVLPSKAFLYSNFYILCFNSLYIYLAQCFPQISNTNPTHKLILNFPPLWPLSKTMTNESVKNCSHDAGKHKQLDREIRDMVSVITNRVTDLHKSGSVNHEDDDETGVRIITLAGNNNGASLRSELDHENNNKPAGLHGGGPAFGEQPDGLSTYVNSNFQSVNNSLMMGGSYSTNDPGVRVDITDVVEPHGYHIKPEKRGWKGKKKEKERENIHSDQHHEHDDE